MKKELRKIALYHRAIICPGGAERLLLQEYLFFKRIGIEVKILTHMITKEALFNYDIPDLEILGGGNPFCRTILLRKRLREINPDLVISASGSLELFLATVFTSLPYILHIHGSLFWFDEDLLKYAIIHRGIFNEARESVRGHIEFIPLKQKCSFINRIKLEFVAILDYLAVRKAKEIIALTPQVRWEVEKLYKKRAVIARGCLDPAIFDYAPKEDIRKKLGINDAKIILSVSRLDHRKRIDMLIKAFVKLSKKVDNAVLVIVGTGPDEKRLRSLTKQLNCSDKIIFTGFVSDDELWDYYHACDVFAFPGWTTSPITTYEALAFQKKVVWSSEASEPDETLNSPQVFIANPDPDSFADALQRALKANVKTSIDLSKYTWSNYFETVHKAIQRHIKDA